jgi:hypothetical protein
MMATAATTAPSIITQTLATFGHCAAAHVDVRRHWSQIESDGACSICMCDVCAGRRCERSRWRVQLRTMIVCIHFLSLQKRGAPVASATRLLCDPRHPSAMTSASEIEYSLTVEFCVRQGSKIVWTLMSKGFKEGEYIYIYRNSKRITAGHCIKNPASPIVIDSWESSLFEDVSKQEEYHFR